MVFKGSCHSSNIHEEMEEEDSPTYQSRKRKGIHLPSDDELGDSGIFICFYLTIDKLVEDNLKYV